MRRAVVALVGALAIAACGGARGSTSSVERTVVEVDNRGFTDMSVYVVNGSARIRLGTAVGLKKTEMVIPPRAVGTARDLQFLADPVGSSRAAVSQRLFVRAGDRVQLVIAP